MATVGVLISSLINALIIGWLARRLLGTPVGWPRTLALSLIVNASTAPLLTWALPQLGVHEVLEWNPDAGAAVLVVGLPPRVRVTAMRGWSSVCSTMPPPNNVV